ncbi:hypothetical protein ACHAWF_015597 [Thalassiosira exigua]
MINSNVVAEVPSAKLVKTSCVSNSETTNDSDSDSKTTDASEKQSAEPQDPKAQDSPYNEFLDLLSQKNGEGASCKVKDPSYDEFVGLLSADSGAETAKPKPAAGSSCPVATGLVPRARAPESSSDSSRPVHLHLGPGNSSGKCPFRHGTVYAGPYPGYVHGNPKRGICPRGCRPELNSEIAESETPKKTLLREATEYIELYYHERRDEMKGVEGFATKEERMAEIQASIDSTGTYAHTFDELQHGARVAWRNSPKCSNRKYWQQLKLLDCRDVTTNRGMYDSCVRHLEKAMSCGSSEAYVTVFRPAPPEKDGPRIWNDQLLQYASYNNDGVVLGDPKNLRFTEMLEERFGWTGPPDGKRGPYDYLPLVVQADPDGPPKLFDLPLEVAPPVHIHHHKYSELSSLNMRWYPIPAVCAMDMDIGGLVYTAVPFNGWYAITEVVRDLTDETRYNLLRPIADALGHDADTKPGEAPLWIDHVMAILGEAVYHSFKAAKIAVVDHFNLINMFYDWYNDEMKYRKYCPVNWKWVIPPMSSSASPAYLGLNQAQEYTLKPNYFVGKSFLQLEVESFGPRDRTKAVNDLIRAVHLALVFKRMISRFRSRKQPVLIIYASVTGNAATYASDLGAILRSGCNVSFVDACGVNSSLDQEPLRLIESSTLTIFVSSTQGNGELPSLSQKFFSNLFDHSGHLLKGRNCAVLGFGSTAYPVFCGAAAHLSSKLAEQGAQEVVVRGQCDAVEGETSAFYQWTSNLVTTLANMDNASPFMLKLANSMEESTASSLVQQRNLMRSIKIELFTHEEVESAAAKSYMRRSGSMGSLRGSFTGGVEEKHEMPRRERILKIIKSSSQQETLAKNMLAGRVISREDLGGSGLGSEVGRKTSVLKIDLKSCGDPPYQPGDHVRVFPRNVVSEHHLGEFIGHLSGDISLLDYMYVTFEDINMPKSELAVALPLVHDNLEQLVPMGYFFEKVVALLAPIPMQALGEMAELATSKKEKVRLKTLGQNKTEYERMNSFNSLKWLGLFGWFPSLSKQVSIPFLLCNMKRNHPRSYSISSCKAIVGSELHLCVGRYLYSCGGSRKEAGICSSFLTSVEPGDEILFKLESAPSFHHPLDPSCPVIFICAGTGESLEPGLDFLWAQLTTCITISQGFAPIRGLLMQRSYFQSRGQKLGAAYMFFGSRCSREGLFHDDLRELVNKRVLTKCYMCYSREPGQQRQHTTDKLQSAKMKAIIAPILKRGDSHVFICGSANLAEQSKSALAEMTSETYMDDFIASGRLHCDVFGAVTPTSSSGPRFVDEIMNTERSGIGMPMD